MKILMLFDKARFFIEKHEKTHDKRDSQRGDAA
jgi:hypothetical protein